MLCRAAGWYLTKLRLHPASSIVESEMSPPSSLTNLSERGYIEGWPFSLQVLNSDISRGYLRAQVLRAECMLFPISLGGYLCSYADMDLTACGS